MIAAAPGVPVFIDTRFDFAAVTSARKLLMHLQFSLTGRTFSIATHSTLQYSIVAARLLKHSLSIADSHCFTAMMRRWWYAACPGESAGLINHPFIRPQQDRRPGS
jgi:hypothetical protein